MVETRLAGMTITSHFSSGYSQRRDVLKPSSRVLTDREREVLQLIAEGKSTKEIAYELNVQCRTVSAHRQNIMEKLALFSIAELTKHAIREGLTTL